MYDAYAIHAPNASSRTWGMLCHLSALIGMLTIPYVGNIVGPLAIWLLKKDHDAFADDQGREALNFQIAITIYGILLAVVVFFSAILSMMLIGLPFLLLSAALLGILWLVDVIVVVVASVRAYQGEAYRYPGSIRFL